MTPLLGAVVDTALKLIDKVIPDPQAKAAAQLEVLRLQQSGHFRQIELELSAIIAEANSPDPYTSRARPTFLYVVYICILAGIPFGLAHIWWPQEVARVVVGFQIWLNAIPDPMWWMFTTGYLGYTGSRTYEKAKGVANERNKS